MCRTRRTQEAAKDPSAFDTLARAFATSGTRRRLVTLLAALPLGGALTTGEEAAAQRPHKRLGRRTKQRNRQQRNRRRRNNNQNNNPGGGGGVGGANCTVCPTSGDCPHTSVQAAHDAANAGDTLTLCAGTYTENVTISKPLILASHPGHTWCCRELAQDRSSRFSPG